jgi:hypothetical protein
MLLIWGFEQYRRPAAQWHDGQFTHDAYARFARRAVALPEAREVHSFHPSTELHPKPGHAASFVRRARMCICRPVRNAPLQCRRCDSCTRRKKQIPARLRPGGAQNLAWWAISSIESRTSPGDRLACRLFEATEFYGSELLIQKLPTIVTAAIPTAATPAVVTARRWRRRPNLTAAAVPTVSVTVPTVSVTAPTVTVTAPTVSIIAPTVTASTVTASTEGTRTKERRTKQRGSKEEAECFGFGGNGSSSKCKSCCEHDGYPAKFQHHDTSPSVYLAVNPHLDCSLRTQTSNKAQAGISSRPSRDISRHGESEDRRDFQWRRLVRVWTMSDLPPESRRHVTGRGSPRTGQ